MYIYPAYFDADLVVNDIEFNGWVNKTQNTVTIENLLYPDWMTIDSQDCCQDFDGDGTYDDNYSKVNYLSANRPVSDTCNLQNKCEIVFYGNGGLTHNGIFYLTEQSQRNDYYADTDNDGILDTEIDMYYWSSHTVTFDLPFEPYGFTLTMVSTSSTGQVDRIF